MSTYFQHTSLVMNLLRFSSGNKLGDLWNYPSLMTNIINQGAAVNPKYWENFFVEIGIRIEACI